MTPELEKPDFAAMIEQMKQRCSEPEYVARLERERADEAERKAREDAELRLARRRNRLDHQGISLPQALEDAVIADDALKPTKALQAVQRWFGAADAPAVLVLSGGTGCGKTVAAAWAMARHGGRWKTAQQLCRLFAANFGDPVEEQEEVVGCRLLVIDDLGAENDAQRMGEVLLEVIDQRQNAARVRTLISTNLSRKDFASRYPSERIASRFASSAGRVAWVSDQSPDLRRTK